MGMIGHLRRLTAAEQAEIEHNPAAIQRLTGRVSVEKRMPATVAALAEVQRIGRELATSGGDREAARQKILEVLASAGVSMPMMGKQRDGTLRLEKSWHVLHYVLSGSAEVVTSPLSQALLGGREVGNDVGYGPARILEPRQGSGNRYGARLRRHQRAGSALRCRPSQEPAHLLRRA